MKKTLLPLSLFTMFISIAALLFLSSEVPGEFRLEKAKGEEEEGEFNKARRIKEAMLWRQAKMLDENGEFHASYYYNAVKEAEAKKLGGARSGAFNLQWEELGPDNIGGRTRAILIDNRDPSGNTIYAGAVSGGLWKSTNGANNWTHITSVNACINITCIAQANNGTIFYGTGEGLAQPSGISFNSGNIGNGVYKLDASDNPTLITPDQFGVANVMDASDTFSLINRIAVDPSDANHLIIATGKGLYQTTNGGATWSGIIIPQVTPSNGSAADVQWAANGIDVYATVGGNNKLVKSPNAGFTWDRITSVSSPGFPTSLGRTELALAPSDANILYISVAASTGATQGVYRSGDGGAHWTTVALKGPLFDPMGSNNQGWYDNTIAVSPADPNKVYTAGVELYTWSNVTGTKLTDAGLGAGNSNPYFVHSDKHAIVIDKNNPNVMYVGCDGGVYKSMDAVTAFPYPTFSVKNRGYATFQNYSVAAALSGEVMGGAQDNGTAYVNFLGNTRRAAEEVMGGDGTYAEISHIDPRIFFAGIYYGETYRSGNKGTSFGGFFDVMIDPQSHNQPSGCAGQENANAQFISPFWLCESYNAANGLKSIPFVSSNTLTAGTEVTVQSKTAKFPIQQTLSSDLTAGDTLWVYDKIRSRFFAHSYCGLWVTNEPLDVGVTPKWFKMTQSMQGVPQSLSQSTDADVVYVGTSSGKVYKFNGLNARLDTITYPVGTNVTAGIVYKGSGGFNLYNVSTRAIEGICVDPNDNDHVVAVTSGFSANSANAPHVFETTNGGTTWTPLVTGLPNMPVYDVVVHDANTIIIATELGIWSWDRANSTWTEENNGFPRMPVFRMIEKPLYNSDCRVIYIGTHGRGMWRSTTLTNGNCQLVAGVENAKENYETGLANLNIYPNPVNGKAKIALSLDKATEVTFRVMDVAGKLYKEFVARNNVKGENLFELDASGLSGGTYLLVATLPNNRTQTRLFTVAK